MSTKEEQVRDESRLKQKLGEMLVTLPSEDIDILLEIFCRKAKCADKTSDVKK